jgi:basic endochitinase B
MTAQAPTAADKAANRLPGYGVTINIINGGIETGQWTPTAADKAANRLPGYGVTINIINGGIECNKGQDPSVTNRINYYKRYCDMLGVSYGSYLSCAKQKPFNT